MTKETTDTTESVDTSTDDTSGLKSKNRELHGIIKSLEAKVAKLTDDVEEAADNARAETGSELDKANRRIQKLEKELGDATTRADKSDKGLREYKANSALATAIASANVDADDVGLLTKALRADIEYDETGEPMIDGKSIDAYTKSFFGGAGKRYVRAADHSGGGATGSEGKSQAITKLPQTDEQWRTFNALPIPERNALADQFNAPSLKL
jgi:outer membrane murein-binding lipoprotein Lpp